jgi:hypothetical protein
MSDAVLHLPKKLVFLAISLGGCAMIRARTPGGRPAPRQSAKSSGGRVTGRRSGDPHRSRKFGVIGKWYRCTLYDRID